MTPTKSRDLSQKMRVSANVALGLLVAVALSNCSKKEDEAANFTTVYAQTFTTVYAQTLSTSCVQCHTTPGSGSQNGANLNFSNQANAYASLTAGNVSGATSVGTCGSVRLVAAGNPAASYLAGTVIQSYSNSSFAGVANCVPYAGHFQSLNLSESQQNNLISWIKAGAQNN